MARDGDEVSYSLTVHLPRIWSLGVTIDFDGHVLAIFRVVLATFLSDKQNSVNEVRQQLLQYT